MFSWWCDFRWPKIALESQNTFAAASVCVSRNGKNGHMDTNSRALQNHFFHTSREILLFHGCTGRFFDVLRCVPRCACALKCVSRLPKLIKKRSRALPVRETKDRCMSQTVISPGRLLLDHQKQTKSTIFVTPLMKYWHFAFIHTPLETPPRGPPSTRSPKRLIFG